MPEPGASGLATGLATPTGVMPAAPQGPGPADPAPAPRWRDSVARILPMAWPVMVGQLAVLAFATFDTLLVGRLGGTQLAMLAVGWAAYVTCFVGLMGTVMAIGPLAGRAFGAGDRQAAGDWLHQTLWLAAGLAVPGVALLVWPEPFLQLSQASPELAAGTRAYLRSVAPALPAALLFAAFRGFAGAISQPRQAMRYQLAALGLKLPLSALLVLGLDTPWGRLPGLGVTGCGLATSCAMWLQVLLAWRALRREPIYAGFGVRLGWPWRHRSLAADADPTGHDALHPPRRAALLALLRLGLPMGLAVLVEVSGFTFMAIFIARLGPAAVAGHQVTANLVAILFMVSLGIATATANLVAQDIGAGRLLHARHLGWHGLALAGAIGLLLGGALTLGRQTVVGFYTTEPAIAAVAVPLLALALVFHVLDAVQTVAAFALRAWHFATGPLLVYAVAVWGVGLGGGYVLAFHGPAGRSAWLQGPQAFWAASTTGLGLAALALCGLLLWAPAAQATRPATPRRA